MKNRARVVIVGGGIAGCSLAYHLTKLGWADVIVVEKGELTCGTTWHSVGNTPLFSTSLNHMRLLKHSLELYQSLEQETGRTASFHQVGSLRLATSPDLMDWYRGIADIARMADVTCDIISLREARELCPLFSEFGVLGAQYMPEDGYVDASSVTHALAKGARDRGAEIHRYTQVRSIRKNRHCEWEVVTESGTLTAEIVVNAAGQWSREVGRMVGVELPILPMEHQYVVTAALPELKVLSKEIPVTRDPERSFYMRQELDGLLIGFYEKNPRPWSIEGVPSGFGQQLLPADFEQIEDYMSGAIERMPILGTAPIKKIVNGPDAYTPDGRFIMGEIPGAKNKNMYVLAGFSCFGIANSGGAGKLLAEWIVEGHPTIDMWEFDVRRYDPHHATRKYLIAKVCETYEKEFAVHYPHEERIAGRPLKTSPIYEQLKAQGAVFQVRAGWERASWFAPPGVEPVDHYTFQRPNWFEHVAEECCAARERVGVLDQTSFAKFEVSGRGARAYLDRLCANRIGVYSGTCVVTQMLNERGGIECDLTVTCVAEEQYWVITAAALATHDGDWMQKHLPEDGSVNLRDITAAYACLTLSGPRARDVLQNVSHDDVSHPGFPFLTCKMIHIGSAPVRAFRLSFIGELGWELYHPIEYQRCVYEAIMDAGREFGIVNYGYRAVDSMRMEKGYRLWGFDITAQTTPYEAGLSRHVKLDKGDFVGREALARQKQEGVQKVLVSLVVECNEAIPHGWEPVLDEATVVGYITSGDYGHTVSKSIGMAYVPVAYAKLGTPLSVLILGERFPARVVAASIYDPFNSKMKQ